MKLITKLLLIVGIVLYFSVIKNVSSTTYKHLPEKKTTQKIYEGFGQNLTPQGVYDEAVKQSWKALENIPSTIIHLRNKGKQ